MKIAREENRADNKKLKLDIRYACIDSTLSNKVPM
jgi:hypothetical protein